MSEHSDGPAPALYEWATKVFAAMKAEAQPDQVDGKPVLTYTGHLTALFRNLEAPNPYYTTVKNALVAQGCMEQLRRGGGSSMSKWVLIKEPEEEGFRDAMQRGQRPRGKVAVLEQQLRDLKRRVGAMDDQLTILWDIEQQRKGA
jgi:hypothetical protein